MAINATNATPALLIDADVSPSRLRRAVFAMVWPAATENLLQLSVGLVNMAMVGRLGAEAIGAVGLSNRLVQIVWALFMTFSTGAIVRIAQAIGARDRDAASNTAEQSLTGATAFILMLSTLLFTFSPALLSAFGAGQPLVRAGTPYLRVLTLGMPVFTIMLVASAVLRGTGDTKTPMRIALLVNLVNVVASYLLIFGRFGFPAWGLIGSAVATVFAQVVGAAVALRILFRPAGPLDLKWRRLWRVDWREIRSIARLGFPNACETLAWQFAAVIMVTLIIRFGTAALAGYQLGLQAEGLSYMPASALGVAATAFTGQCVGARLPEQGRRYVNELLGWSLFGTLAVSAVFFAFARPIMTLLTNDAAVIAVGALYLRYMALVQLPQNISGVLNGSLRGAGHTRQPLVAIAFGLWFVRIPLALLLSRTTSLGLSAIWIAINIDMTVRLILSYYFFRRLAFR